MMYVCVRSGDSRERVVASLRITIAVISVIGIATYPKTDEGGIIRLSCNLLVS